MTVLILNRSAMSYSAYHEWFASQPTTDLVYLTAPGKRDLKPDRQAKADAAYKLIREYDDYDTSDMLEWDVLELHKSSPFTALVALSEWDQIRAGRLRRHLRLSGTTENVALHYRDKLLMKQVLRAKHIPVADFADVSNLLDLIHFVETVGFPILIKPRLLAASKGLEVINDMQELYAFARTGFGASVEAQRNLIAEAFVDFATEYHIDGIVIDGEVRFLWPSRYIGQTSEFQSTSLFGSVMLGADNPKAAVLCDLVADTIKALPSLENSTFHAEIFETHDGKFLLNEIAARTGGFRINDHIKAGFGFWLNREWARLQAGMPTDIKPTLNRKSTPAQLAGYVLLRPNAGVVRAIPQTCPFDFVYDYRTDATVGQRYDIGQSSISQLASAVVVGSSEEEVQAHLAQVHDWFYDALKMERT